MGSAIDQSADGPFVGWVSGPKDRGSIDMIWSCVAVLVTAIWTVIHLNLPAEGDGYWTVVLRRARWGLVSIFAPDMLTLFAASQWHRASTSVEEMRELSKTDSWELVHAFYANSGGFVLQTPQDHAFPVNAASIHHLVSRGYIELPDVTAKELWDKSKSDAFAKAVSLIQGGWVVIQAVARTVLGLPLAPLELFTLAFVVSTFMSYYFWWKKPQQAESPTVIYCLYSLAKIRADAGLAADDWVDTPMDFVEKPLQPWERRPMFRQFDLEKATSRHGDVRVPRGRIPDDEAISSPLPPRVMIALVIPSMIHSTIHLLAWNAHFPTELEKALWRVSALTLLVMSSLAVGMTRVLAAVGYRQQFSLTFFWINRNRERSPGTTLLDCFLVFCFVGLVVARCYIIVEVVVSFRSLPRDCYQGIGWTNLIPHI